MTWQPIETAPRDGTWFIIDKFPRIGDDVEAEIGRYNPLMLTRYEEVDGGLYRKTEVEGYEWDGFNNFHRATHWHPLPAPPEGEA